MRVALSSFAAAAATPEGGMQERAVEPSPHRRRRPGRGNAVRGDLCGGSGGPGECGARRQASRWRRQPKTGGMQGAPSRHLCGGGGGPSRGNEGRTVTSSLWQRRRPQQGECRAHCQTSRQHRWPPAWGMRGASGRPQQGKYGARCQALWQRRRPRQGGCGACGRRRPRKAACRCHTIFAAAAAAPSGGMQGTPSSFASAAAAPTMGNAGRAAAAAAAPEGQVRGALMSFAAAAGTPTGRMRGARLVAASAALLVAVAWSFASAAVTAARQWPHRRTRCRCAAMATPSRSLLRRGDDRTGALVTAVWRELGQRNHCRGLARAAMA